MTQGVLIYAFNNQELDYATLAVEAARRVKIFLNKPVTIVTDSVEWLKQSNPQYSLYVDSIVSISRDDELYTIIHNDNIRRYHDGTLSERKLTFKNQIRTKTYELSPYNETLVIDSDFLIANDNLKYCWNQPSDFLIWKESQDLSGYRTDDKLIKLSDYTIDFYWATVFFFRKSEETKIFFDLVDYIRENWGYYKLLYQFSTPIFRNDHAFSIAIHIINGYTKSNWHSILPGRLLHTIDKDLLIKSTDTDFTFLIEKENYQGEFTAMTTKNVSVHVMNKFSILRVLKEGVNV